MVKKRNADSKSGVFRFSDPGGIRTPSRQSRNLIFYPVELRSQL